MDEHSDLANAVIELLRSMSQEYRRDVFSEFCATCGADDPGCQCWNDE